MLKYGPRCGARVIDDTTLVSLLAVAVPVIVVLAVGYVKRGRQGAEQGVKIDHLVDLAEKGEREHTEMKARIAALETEVAVLKALIEKNGHQKR